MQEQVDQQWMQHALQLARLGLGTTSPNPPVGAVIVFNGQVLGEGFHEVAGEAHAERRAIDDAYARGNGHLLPGATIYVTLEPCSSTGRTGACTDAIIKERFARVVYGSTDPDMRHQGRADALLRVEGIEVCPGVCKDACDRLLRSWFHAVQTGRPWVTAKVATTLDGRMTRRQKFWLSGVDTLRYAHQLRLESDAILVGGNTLRTDDPALTVRNPLQTPSPRKQQPWRVVLTTNLLSLPPMAKLFTDEHHKRTLVWENVKDLRVILNELYTRYGVVNLMLECGGRLLRRFLEDGLVNEWMQSISPMVGAGPDSVVPGDFLPNEFIFQREELIECGRDIIIRGILG
ncbi:MAG: bifunctional diaminohydroxyphosphoribosylaminopyrimidine deaminase/5-amino-6-(5-phosphoribosylamino)uracil reductase RibD [Akkermansia sp.]|nr:bifunctional diaminohydroxyphosphoribosylaminopyrimidine deaminase/5-amino-6-(5-phosphoribosylamino)uracil reductase RibD [Akkermansia sp.]